ncbi:MAG TPA: hypothetical protein VD902_09060 [Symbiobacteriaceae bacterium]|nr:hypothetical protein [Symbiobacteriaceae bacterium]
MQFLSFEFENEKEMRETVKKLWEQYGVSGEMAIRPLGSDRWRLDITSEKDLRDSTLEKFEKFRVKAGD